MLAFFSVCMDSRACACVSQCRDCYACVSQCLNGLSCLCLCFSVYGLLRLRFSVFVWTLKVVLVCAFLSVCMDSCASVFVWALMLALTITQYTCACVAA